MKYEFPEVNDVKALYPHGYHKTDVEGRPIYMERIGDIDLKILFTVTSQERLLRYYVREYERVM